MKLQCECNLTFYVIQSIFLTKQMVLLLLLLLSFSAAA